MDARVGSAWESDGDRLSQPATPMVATSTITRGACNSRRITLSLDERAEERADHQQRWRGRPERDVVLERQREQRPAPTTPMLPTAKLMTLVDR